MVAPSPLPRPRQLINALVNAGLSSGQGYLGPQEVEALSEAMSVLAAWAEEAMPADVAERLAELLADL